MPPQLPARLVIHGVDEHRKPSPPKILDDLASQRVPVEPVAVSLDQLRREVVAQRPLEPGVVGQAGRQQVALGDQLGVGDQDRELRRGEAELLVVPTVDVTVGREVLDRAVQVAVSRLMNSASVERW